VSRLAVFGTLAVALAVWAATGRGAPAPPAPTITAFPPALSNARSATFTYTDAQPVTRFECSLDGGPFTPCGTARPSSRTVNGLADGAHAFGVRAVAGGATSAATSYAWTVDATAPRVVSITRAGASPTNAATVAWTVTFSESVTGVAADGGNFALVGAGLTGTPAIVPPVAGSAAVYTATASTGAGGGTLALRLATAGSVRDAAGNALAGAPVTGQAYTVDGTPPPAPAIRSGPPAVSASTQATFRFADAEGGVAFLCSLGGAYAACTSPATYAGVGQGPQAFRVEAADAAGNVSGPASLAFVVDTVPPGPPALAQQPADPTASQTATFAWTATDPAPGTGVASFTCKLDRRPALACASPTAYTGLALGQHAFSVVAVDGAGSSSEATTFTWTVAQQGLPFTIAGNGAGLLYPGAPFTPLALTITNANAVPIVVTSITVTATNDPNGCASAANLVVQQSPASPANGLTVPANAVAWPVPAAFLPAVRLADTGESQDACRGQTLTLAYAGSAHS
jgi:hypothetical protein